MNNIKTTIHAISNLFNTNEFNIRPDIFNADQQLVIYKKVTLTNPLHVFQTLFNLDNQAIITSFTITDESGKYIITDDYMNQCVLLRKLTKDNAMVEDISVTKLNKLFSNKPVKIIVRVDKE